MVVCYHALSFVDDDWRAIANYSIIEGEDERNVRGVEGVADRRRPEQERPAQRR